MMVIGCTSTVILVVGARFHPKVAEMPSQNSSQMRQKFYQG
jgi:hypothetical protein